MSEASLHFTEHDGNAEPPSRAQGCPIGPLSCVSLGFVQGARPGPLNVAAAFVSPGADRTHFKEDEQTDFPRALQFV